MATSTSAALKCSNLTDYLKTLPKDTLERLYHHPATCLAVFREVPALAKQYVMRLLYVEHPVPRAVVESWVTTNKSADATDASAALTDLGLWIETSISGGLSSWVLYKVFRENLKIALTGGGTQWIISGLVDQDPNKRAVSYLDQYSKERWNTVRFRLFARVYYFLAEFYF